MLLLEIRVNGRLLPGIIRAERVGDGRLVLPAETWAEARLNLAGGAIALSDGSSGYALEAAAGLVYSINASTLSLDITAPAAAFEATQLSLDRRFPLPSGPRLPGAYLSYDAAYTGTEGSGPSYGALVEGVAFGRAGALINNVVLRDSAAHKDVIRIDSSWRVDRPARMETLVFGDTISSGAAWSRPGAATAEYGMHAISILHRASSRIRCRRLRAPRPCRRRWTC